MNWVITSLALVPVLCMSCARPTGREPHIGRSLLEPSVQPAGKGSNDGARSDQSEAADLSLAIRDAYKSFRYDDAIDGARRLSKNRQTMANQRAEAYVLAGAAAYLQGRQRKAEFFFRKALSLDPHANPDRHMFPGTILRLFRSVEESVLNR